MNTLTTNQEFNKIKNELMKDLKIIQTEYANSEKKLKIAEEVIKKAKIEYKKLNDDYIKLIGYKNKCEKFIQYLQDENSKAIQKLNNLYEKQQQQQQEQNYNIKYKYIRNNYQRLLDQQEEQEEEEVEEEEEKQEEEDISDEKPLITKKKANRPQPKKKN